MAQCAELSCMLRQPGETEWKQVQCERPEGHTGIHQVKRPDYTFSWGHDCGWKVENCPKGLGIIAR